MSVKKITPSGQEVQSFEEWKSSRDYVESRQKEIESGTEPPEILMPNSPLEDRFKDISQESTAVSVIDAHETKSIKYTPLIISACFGFLIGVLVAFIFFRMKIKQIRNECDTKVNEARATLDRMLLFATKK